MSRLTEDFVGKLADLFRSAAPAARPAVPPQMPLELHPQVVADADACHRAGRDVGHCTTGIGAVTDLRLAGTPQRQDVLWAVANRHRQPTPDGYLPAVVMREPSNPHDPNAVRVYCDGVTVGYLFRDKAKQWQPVLKEVERRGQVLVGGLRFYGGHGEPLGAAVRLRDNLPGYAGPVTKARSAQEKAARDARAVRDSGPKRLDGDDRLAVLRELDRLAGQDPVRTKQAAGLAVKQFRMLLPALFAHANALTAAAPADATPPFVDLLDDAETEADALLSDPENADDREDAHISFASALEDLAAALRAT